MTAATLHLADLEQGATYRRSLTFGTADEDGNLLAPYDITDCQVRMQIRKKVLGDVYLDATTENGLIRTDGPAGAIFLEFDEEATNGLTYPRCVYDLEIVIPTARGDLAEGVYRLLQGNVTVSLNVTQEVPEDD